MRIGLISELMSDLTPGETGPADINSGLLSEEEEDELLSGLRDAGHEVLRIRGVSSLLSRMSYFRRHCDLVFNKSCGYRGVDEKLLAPAILEAACIPYVGSAPYVQALVRNKFHTKLVVAAAGVPTPPAAVVVNGEEPDLGHLKFPAIVKPIGESSSLGLEAGKAVVGDAASAVARARELIRLYHQPAIIEMFIRGMEVEVPIVTDPGPRALGVVAVTANGQLVSGDVYLTSEMVYHDDYGFTTPPTGIDVENIARAATRAATALGVRDYARVDFRIADDGTPWLMEANTSPHVQRHSAFYTLAKQRGIAYHEMLDQIIQIAAKRIPAPSPQVHGSRQRKRRTAR